ncbi:MAG: hypothetical protein NT013_03885 [Planctomycetia bacterium]|nr:hypothetical protein [Planctomycetia bacterium]
MDDTLLSSPTSLSIAELLAVNRQLLDQIPSLLARLDQVEAENRELRRETSILKCEVGFWKSRHADALLRIPEKDRLYRVTAGRDQATQESSVRTPDREILEGIDGSLEHAAR